MENPSGCLNVLVRVLRVRDRNRHIEGPADGPAFLALDAECDHGERLVALMQGEVQSKYVDRFCHLNCSGAVSDSHTVACVVGHSPLAGGAPLAVSA